MSPPRYELETNAANQSREDCRHNKSFLVANIPRKRRKLEGQVQLKTRQFLDYVEIPPHPLHSWLPVGTSPEDSDTELNIMTGLLSRSSSVSLEGRLDNQATTSMAAIHMTSRSRSLSLDTSEKRSDGNIYHQIYKTNNIQTISDSVASYKADLDELIEDQHLHIIGEVRPESIHGDCDSVSSEEPAEDLPIRYLSDFTLYEWTSHKLLPLQIPNGILYGGSGKVTPMFENDDDENEEDLEWDGDIDGSPVSTSFDGQRVKLDTIKEFWLDFQYEDPKIWLQTKYAWYILNQPSDGYLPYYEPIFIVHLLTYLIVSAVKMNTNIQYCQFVASLEVGANSSNATASAMKVLGRSLSVVDLESDAVKPYLQINLHDWLSSRCSKVFRTAALIKSILGAADTSSEDEYSDRSDETQDVNTTQKKKKRTILPHSNPEKQVLTHRNNTIVTPTVAAIAKGLFYRTLVVSGQNLEGLDYNTEDFANVCVPTVPLVIHEENPQSIVWGKQFPGQQHFYMSVFLDGVEYKPGDTVVVAAGEDEDTVDAVNAIKESAQAKNQLANKAWFCTIQYLFEKDPELKTVQKVFHGRWFVHGSKTLLAETSNPHLLFLMNKCDTNLLSSILQKCNIHRLEKGEKEPIFTDNDHGFNDNMFHYRYIWDRESLAFYDPEMESISLVSQLCDPHKACYSCALQLANDAQKECKILESSVSQYGVTYHCFDFVYVRAGYSGLLGVAQVLDIKHAPKLDVIFLGRCNEFLHLRKNKCDPHSQRHLFMTTKMTTILIDDLDGHCVVQHKSLIKDLDIWVGQDDHFFVTSQSLSTTLQSLEDLVDISCYDFQQCKLCWSSRQSHIKNENKFKQESRGLRTMELFSGAGGLSTGMEMSGFIKTHWAVEFSPGAAKTFKENHPETIVYNEDTNCFLQRAMDFHSIKSHGLVGDNARLLTLPQPGDVDLIMGGPPCQSFSGMNHYKKADDIRHTLVCNMISYVEFYHPKYFLLENVTGLLNCSLRGQQVGRRIVGGIKSGIIKFIIRSLNSLGYQTSFKVLQAAHYGAPQSRNRVIIWGARHGVLLPQFPIPTHAFEKVSRCHKLSTVGILTPVSRSKRPDDEEPHQCAPLHAVTVFDAIDDLPGFDWQNPHHLLPASATDYKEANLRAQRYPCLCASGPEAAKDVIGFDRTQPYTHEPFTSYQAWSRHCMDKEEGPSYHYTAQYTAEVVERTVNVPLFPKADHSDLPHALLTVNRVSGEGLQRARGTYGRVDADGYFNTAMTTLRPNSKGMICLHPTQKRVLTVRECARAQGFPDHFKFLSVNKRRTDIIADQYRQIGNAVPIPLALALGKALGEALLGTWRMEEDTGDEGRSEKVDHDNGWVQDYDSEDIVNKNSSRFGQGFDDGNVSEEY